jgi:subtilisin family serine protease
MVFACRLLCLVALVLAPLPAIAGAGGRTPFIPAELEQKASTGTSVRVIVQLAEPVTPAEFLRPVTATAARQRIAAAQGAVRAALHAVQHRTVHQFRTVPLLAVEVDLHGLRVLEGLRGVVASVMEDELNSPALAQSVPLISAPQAWTRSFDGQGTVVAVLDTGVDREHPFLSGKVVEEACFSSGGQCPNGQTTQFGFGAAAPCTYALGGCQHGTHVAGIVAGGNATFSGVAPGSRVLAIQVFSRGTGAACGYDEDPCAVAWTSDVIAALEHVYSKRSSHAIAAVNMSLGGGRAYAPCDSDPAKSIIDNLRAAGIATVVSSGNAGYTDSISKPACISSAISVGSSEDGSYGSIADTVSDFSNSAPFLSLLAPGCWIDSSVPGGGYSTWQGTSMAAPHVAGAFAILRQAAPGSSVTDLLDALRLTGQPITDWRNGVTTPRILVNAALDGTSRPANDDFADAQLLTGAAGAVTGDNTGGTAEPGEPAHAGTPARASIWYRWTAPATGTVTFDTLGSNFDTVLAVYTGANVTGLAGIVANDNAPGGLQSRVQFEALSGTTYRVAVDGFAGAVGNVNLTWRVSLLSAPTPLSPPDGATVATAPTLRWTAVAGATSYRVMVAATLGDLPSDPGADSCIACTISAAVNTTSYTIPTGALQGAITYYWQVTARSATQLGGWSTQSSFTTEAASNDNFVNAQPLSGASGTVAGRNVGATSEPGEPSPFWCGAQASIWYRWTAPATGTVTFDTVGSNFDTVLAVYTGSTIGSLTGVAANDDMPGSLQSRVQVLATAGTTYRIAVDGFCGGAGNVTLNWSVSLLTAPVLLSPPNGANGVSSTASFGWTAVAGVTSYRLMVAASLAALPSDPATETCPACVLNVTSSSPSYTSPTGVLQGTTTYFWQVKARSGTQPGWWSSRWSFTTANTTPNLPSGLGQFSSETAPVPVGALTRQRIVLKALVSDASDGGHVRLEVELRLVGTSFSNSATHQSGLIANGGVASVTLPPLTNGSYHWQARTVDEYGLGSAWVAFGGNSESAADFSVFPGFTLAVKIGGSASGAIVSNSGGISCAPVCSALFDGNAGIVLTAAPAQGARFLRWSGACNGTAPSCTLTMNASKTVLATFSALFTDALITNGSTPIKAEHITELRAATDSLRVAGGLSRFSWTDPVLTARTTPIKRQHVLDLRTALDQIYVAAGKPLPDYTDPTLTPAIPVRALHLSELRTSVRALE